MSSEDYFVDQLVEVYSRSILGGTWCIGLVQSISSSGELTVAYAAPGDWEAPFSKSLPADSHDLRQADVKRYDFDDPRSLLRLLADADIKLLRGSYLVELEARRGVLQRRQEMEHERTASGEPALISAEELRRTDRKQIFAISHAWESMQHPDPFGHQLSEIVRVLQAPVKEEMNALRREEITQCFHFRSLFRGFERSAVFRRRARFRRFREQVRLEDHFLFFDYACLYQFKRATFKEMVSFKLAMCNMHVIYAHPKATSLVVDTLTPRSRLLYHKALEWLCCFPSKTVSIYEERTDTVAAVPVSKLVANLNPYWVFDERITGCRKLTLQWVDLSVEMLDDLAAALPFYTSLRGVTISFSRGSHFSESLHLPSGALVLSALARALRHCPRWWTLTLEITADRWRSNGEKAFVHTQLSLLTLTIAAEAWIDLGRPEEFDELEHELYDQHELLVEGYLSHSLLDLGESLSQMFPNPQDVNEEYWLRFVAALVHHVIDETPVAEPGQRSEETQLISSGITAR
ncbi:hypothetical protein AK812_SmicGene45410 [Symbiodinium microadriaticum]|nr:hypothetical protein AK812_SmicGene45410 [Symbiodinium microadriaticum]CAE7192470.1 unnamed protein product [Symbiodinium microadriaticum]